MPNALENLMSDLASETVFDYDKKWMGDMIAEIHRSKLYGRFIEIGAGLALSEELFKYPGASKTVYDVQSLYSKAAQEKYIGHGGNRSVSQQQVEDLLEKMIEDTDEKDVNFFMATSFQIGDNDQKIASHGWVGIYAHENAVYFSRKAYFHINLPIVATRQENILQIKRALIQLVYDHIDGSKKQRFPTHVNMIEDGKTFYPQYMPYAKSTEEEVLYRYMADAGLVTDHEEFICFKDGKFVNFEDIFRDKKVLIYRGSFNPLSLSHEQIFDEAYYQINRPGNSVERVMMISLDTYDKGFVGRRDLFVRMHMINSIGYTVVICRKKYFADTAEFLAQRFGDEYKHNIGFVVGNDTYERIDFSDKILENITFIVAARNGVFPDFPEKHHCKFKKLNNYDDTDSISSTDIRNFLIEGNLEEVKKRVSPKIYDALVRAREEKIEARGMINIEALKRWR